MRTIRALLVSIVIIVVAFVAFSYWSGSAAYRSPRAGQAGALGTSGKVDVNAARERGAEVGEKVAIATEKMKETAAEAAVTSKIKAKMVLDDYVKARAIDVTTSGSTVTLSGTVRSPEEHDRAVRIARDTAGVSQVVDHLSVAR
jgi:hyperosmotically inducible periplasmic protein